MIASWLILTFVCFYRLSAHTGKTSYDCLLALRHHVWQCTVSRTTQQKFGVVDCAELHSGAWRCRRPSSFCCNCRDRLFDHTKLIQKNVHHHRQGKNNTVTTASRDWRVIYSDSSDNFYMVNADGMKVAWSYWGIFEVSRQHSGMAGAARTLSRGIGDSVARRPHCLLASPSEVPPPCHLLSVDGS